MQCGVQGPGTEIRPWKNWGSSNKVCCLVNGAVPMLISCFDNCTMVI